ncbi:MAG: hypothetical protein WC806_02095 [Candidatus Gracilibacteria bacterium]|jgi:hypothetical protein
MIESIILIIFLLSLGGVLLILARKMPVLNSLPQNGTTGIKKHHIIADLEIKIKDILIYFEKQIFLHKLLSWVKVIALKIETRTDALLHKIRKNAQQIDKKNKDKN